MFNKKYQFPKHINYENGLLFLKGHLYLSDRQIDLKDITSIRIHATDSKQSMNGIPNGRFLSQDITIQSKKDEDIIIYMKTISKMFWFDPLKEGSKSSKIFSDAYEFMKFVEEETVENRLNKYLDNQTDDILINYNSRKSSLFSKSNKNNYIFYKDGTITRDGKYFTTLDVEKNNITLSYKTICFTKKETGYKDFLNSYREIDISWDFDIIIQILSKYFNIIIQPSKT